MDARFDNGHLNYANAAFQMLAAGGILSACVVVWVGGIIVTNLLGHWTCYREVVSLTHSHPTVR